MHKKTVDIPTTSAMMEDELGPWVLTYSDSGPKAPSPGGGWPTRFALYFQSYEAMREYWDEHQDKAGRNHKVDYFPLKIPQETK